MNFVFLKLSDKDAGSSFGMETCAPMNYEVEPRGLKLKHAVCYVPVYFQKLPKFSMISSNDRGLHALM